jgi:hypothetical protein
MKLSVLLIVSVFALTTSLHAGLTVYPFKKCSPSAGTHTLGLAAGLPITVWFDDFEIESVHIRLGDESSTISKQSFVEDGSLKTVQAEFSKWKYGDNVVEIYFFDRNNERRQLKEITYHLVKRSDMSDGASGQNSPSPVGTWIYSYTTGTRDKGNRVTSINTLKFATDGTCTSTLLSKGYADPNMTYADGPGIGDWSLTITTTLSWKQNSDGSYTTTTVDRALDGETRYALPNPAWTPGHQASFILQDGALQYTTGDKNTFHQQN